MTNKRVKRKAVNSATNSKQFVDYDHRRTFDPTNYGYDESTGQFVSLSGHGKHRVELALPEVEVKPSQPLNKEKHWDDRYREEDALYDFKRSLGLYPEFDGLKKDIKAWRLPTKEYQDLLNYNDLKFNSLSPKQQISLINNGYRQDELKLGARNNANAKYNWRKDGLSFANWYYYQCAQAANDLNRRLGVPTDGNAWTRHGLFGDSLIFDNSNLKYEYERDKRNVFKLDLGALQNGDIVDLYYDYTTHGEQARREGRGNSHTGTVVINPANATPYVFDNMGGDIRLTDIKKFLTNNGSTHVGRIYRPGTRVNPFKNSRYKNSRYYQEKYNPQDYGNSDYNYDNDEDYIQFLKDTNAYKYGGHISLLGY